MQMLVHETTLGPKKVLIFDAALGVSHCLVHLMPTVKASWGNAEAGAMPKIAIVQKPCCTMACYLEATCRLPYEALVEVINACLPTKQKQVFPFHKASENVSLVCLPAHP